MLAIWKDDVSTDIVSDDVGSCFKEVLDSANECARNAKESVEASMEGFDPPTEEEIAAFKAEMKKRRSGNRNNRKNKRNNRRNNRRQRKQWKQSEDEDETEDND